MRLERWLKRAAFVFVFLWFAIGGCFHFAATGAEMQILPPYIPWPRVTVLMTALRRTAGMGLVLLTIAVTPANVFMLQHADRFHIAPWLLEARLVVQVLLLVLIVWSTWSADRLWRAT